MITRNNALSDAWPKSKRMHGSVLSGAATGGFLLFQLIDQIDQVEEAASGAGTDDRRGNGDAQMGFAGAGAADEDRVALGIQEGAGGEFANCPSSTAVSAKTNLSRSLRTGNLASPMR
jgi:hypothetical protein